eukprot:scaffold44182_cov57-Phaeocystis_antarctica.AAC.3
MRSSVGLPRPHQKVTARDVSPERPGRVISRARCDSISRAEERNRLHLRTLRPAAPPYLRRARHALGRGGAAAA